MYQIFVPEINQYIHLKLDSPLSEESVNKCIERYNRIIVKYYDDPDYQSNLLEIFKQVHACKILIKYILMSNMQLRIKFNSLADKKAEKDIDPKDRALLSKLSYTFGTILKFRGSKWEEPRCNR